MTQNYQKTKYSAIYKNSYWGQHRTLDMLSDELVQNRNELVELYEIKSYKNKVSLGCLKKAQIRIDREGNKLCFQNSNDCRYSIPQIHEWYRNHTEYYKLKCFQNKTLSVFSTHTTDKEHEAILQHGYIKSKPIYALNQKTYLKVL